LSVNSAPNPVKKRKGVVPMPRHRRDETGELFNIAKKLVTSKKSTEFAHLKKVRILFTWRDTARKDDEGRSVAARASKLGPQIRDLIGKDAMIEVFEDIWPRLSPKWRVRLIKHELRHINVVFDEESGEPKYDKDGRIKIEIVPHDVVIKTFKAEILEYGVSTTDLPAVAFLADVHRKHKKGDLSTYKTPEALLEAEESEDEGEGE
jgi:hypothetical protein